MRQLKKINTFRQLPGSVKWLFFQSVFISAAAGIALRFFPFRIIMKWLGTTNQNSSDAPDPANLHYRRQVATAVRLCNLYTPWRTRCYTLSLTAKILLNRKKIPATLYIGFRKEDGAYKGHAWLRSADKIITGGEIAKDYTVHSFFT